jgi:acyl carrier protein
VKGRKPMNEQQHQDDIVERVRRVVSEALQEDPETLGLDTPLFEDEYPMVAGLHMVEVHVALEEEFHFSISDDELIRLQTLRDIIAYVRRRLAASSGRPRCSSPLEGTHIPGEQNSGHTQKATNGPASRSTASPGRKKGGKGSSTSLLAWSFDIGRWEPVEDIMADYEQREKADFAAALRYFNYSATPMIRMGTREHGFKVEVYYAERDASVPASHAYYVNLSVGQKCEAIYVANLPSLITLLSRFGTIVGNIGNPGEDGE